MRNRAIFVIIAVILLFRTSISCAQELLLFDRAGLESLKGEIHAGGRQELAKRLQWAANSALKLQPVTVKSKRVLPPGADGSNYVSLSRYYWPDSSSSTGLPYISRDGVTNPEREDSARYDAVRMEKMIGAVSALTLEYYMSGQEIYAEHAAVLLRTWFINPDTRMKPNLDYGQGVPGKRSGSPSGIIETAGLIEVTDSVRMLEGSPVWTADDAAAVREWFSTYLDWLLTSPLGQKESKTMNNHAVWYDAQVASFAWFTHREDIAAGVVSAAKARRIAAQIEPDGSMPREMARTRPLHYCMYNAAAFMTLARIGDQLGINLWDYQTADGRGIGQMLGYLLPAFDGQADWSKTSVVTEKPSWFCRYLAMAEQKWQTGIYKSKATQLLDGTRAKEAIALASFIR